MVRCQETKVVAAKIGFFTMTERALDKGEVLNTALLHKAYEDIFSSNNVNNPMCSRKMVKRLFQDEISGIEFPKS